MGNVPLPGSAAKNAGRIWSHVPGVLLAIGAAAIGILSLAIGIAGYLNRPLHALARGFMFVAAALLLLPHIEIGSRDIGLYVNIAGAILFLGTCAASWTGVSRSGGGSAA